MFKAGQSFAKEVADGEASESEINSFLEKIGVLNAFSSSKKRSREDQRTIAQQRTDALDFMRGIMDECTHLGNFSVPVDPSLAIIVQATHDAYVPRQGLIPLDRIWAGSSVRQIDGGHVTAIILKNKVFREAIFDSMELTANKYHNTSLKEAVDAAQNYVDDEQFSLIFNNLSANPTPIINSLSVSGQEQEHLAHCALANLRTNDAAAINMISCTCDRNEERK